MATVSYLGILLLATGCAPSWKVIQQSGPPAALLGASALTVAWEAQDLELDGEPMEARLALLPPTERADVEKALSEMRQTFLRELQADLPVPVSVASGPPAGREARVRARLLELESGPRGPVGATRLVMEVECIVDGEVVDAIRIEKSEPPSMTCPSVAERIRALATDAARTTARFYRSEQKRE